MAPESRPWVIYPAGPYHWQSHEIIRPAFLEFFSRFSGRCEPLYFPNPRFTAGLRRDLAKASCIVLPLSIEESMGSMLEARRKFGWKVPYVFMVAGQLARGGLSIFRHFGMISPEDHFVANSGPEYDLVRAAFPRHRNIHRIPLPVLERDMHPSDEVARARFRERLGMRPGEKLIVYTGRLSCQKNVHGLLAIFAQALRKDPGLRLYVLGGADDIGVPHLGLQLETRYPIYLSQLVGELGLQRSVSFTGALPRHELRQFLASCDAYVSLSLNFEDYGYAIAEAILCGAPVVTTAWGGPLDFAEGGGAVGVPVEVTRNGPRIDFEFARESILRMSREEECRRQRTRALAYARREISELAIQRRWEEVLKATRKSRGGRVFASRRFIEFQMEVIDRQEKFIAREPLMRIGSYNCFGAPENPMYRWTCSVYAGGDKAKKNPPSRRLAYFHPLFSPQTGILNDPMVARRDFSFSPGDLKKIQNWYLKGGRTKVRKDLLFKRLRDEGIIIVSTRTSGNRRTPLKHRPEPCKPEPRGSGDRTSGTRPARFPPRY